MRGPSAAGTTVGGAPARRGVALAAVLAMLAAAPMVVMPARSASADPVGAARARATALAAELAVQAAQVHRVTLQYVDAEDKVQAIDEQVVAAQAATASSRRQLGRATAELRKEAVLAFLQIGMAGRFTDILAQAPDAYEVGQVYLGVTSAHLGSAVDAYRAAQRAAQGREASLRAAERRAVAAASAILSVRHGLQATFAEEAATLSQVKGRLAQLVAQAQAQAQAQVIDARRAELARQAAVAQATVADRQAVADAPAAPGTGQVSAQTAAPVSPPSSASSGGSGLPQGLPTPAGVASLAAAPAPAPSAGSGAFAALRQCESGGNYAADTGNGYYGAYQFSAATWAGLGYRGLPSQASPAEQDQAAARLQAGSGWGQWPTCSAMLGLV
ncbi:MAG: transglycosylase family protein [Acidimicrobiales bacterium]